MKVLFDGDVLVCRAGYSITKTTYSLMLEHGSSLEFSYLDEAESVATTLLGDYQIVPTRTSGCLSHAIRNCGGMIDMVMRKFPDAEKVIYLTSKDKSNFRFKVAVTQGYKANRDPGSRPPFESELRQWLIEKHGAIEVFGKEADDALGAASSDDTVIVSIDKDMLMIPGIHHNLASGSTVTASDPGELWMDHRASTRKILRGHGFKWFCAQMLMGDPVDNIKGLRGYGPVKTLAALDKALTVRDLWATVIREYRKNKQQHRLEENRLLLWIERSKSFEEVIHDKVHMQ